MGTTSLVVWGSTVIDTTGNAVNVLVFQRVDSITPIGEPMLLTASDERPYSFVHVVPFLDRFLVLWNDERSGAPGLYARAVLLDGTLEPGPSRRIDSIPVLGMKSYGVATEGGVVLGWNTVLPQMSRLYAFDSVGTPRGEVERFDQRIAGDWQPKIFTGGWMINFTDGSGAFITPGGDVEEWRVPAPTLHHQLVFDEDLSAWRFDGGGAEYKYRRVWETAPIDTIRFPHVAGAFSGVALGSRISPDTFALYYLTHDDYAVPPPDRTDWAREYKTWAHTIYYSRDSGEIGRDTQLIRSGDYSRYYDDRGNSHETTREYVGSSSQATCGGARHFYFVWKGTYRNSQLAGSTTYFDTVTMTIDPMTGAFTTQRFPLCSYPVFAPTPRYPDKGKIDVEINGKRISLRAGTVHVPHHYHAGWLGCASDSGRLYLSYSHRFTSGSFPNTTLYEVTDFSNGSSVALGSLTYPLLEPFDGFGYYKELIRTDHVVGGYSYSLGSSLLTMCVQWRMDKWEQIRTSEIPEFYTYKISSGIQAGGRWLEAGWPLSEEKTVGGGYGSIGMPSMMGVATNPNTRTHFALIGKDTNWDYVEFNRSGEVLRRANPSFPRWVKSWFTYRSAQFFPGDNGNVYFIDGDTAFHNLGKRPSDTILFPTSLLNVSYQRLYGNRFLRLGFLDSSLLAMEVYDLTGDLIADTIIEGISQNDHRFLLAGMGDSAIVLVTGDSLGVTARFFNQSLRPTGDPVSVAKTPVISSICATIVNDSCAIFWIGPSDSATDVFGASIPMPPIPELVQNLDSSVSEETPSDSSETVPLPGDLEPTRAVVSSPLISPYGDIVTLTPIPNPATSSIDLRVRLTQPWPVTITLADESGRVVLRREALASVAGENIFRLDVGELMPGAYTVQLAAGRGQGEGKLIIAR